MTTTAQRIKMIREELCHGDNGVFARRIGKSKQHASALCIGSTRAGNATLELLLDTFPQVSREWLYFGTGAMLDYSRTPSTDTLPDILGDIASHLTFLLNDINRLASCVSKSAS